LIRIFFLAAFRSRRSQPLASLTIDPVIDAPRMRLSACRAIYVAGTHLLLFWTALPDAPRCPVPSPHRHSREKRESRADADVQVADKIGLSAEIGSSRVHALLIRA
jgi:hypothetical protein